jgi:hypothetical protein
MSISYLRKIGNGDAHFDSEGYGLVMGAALQLPFPPIASLADGVAVGTVQSKLHVPFSHRLRGVYGTITGATAVAAGTDPAFDVYRHLPTPASAPTAALVSPAAAGNIENGTHIYAVAFYNGAGITAPGPVTAAVTVADKTTNGKVLLSDLPIGPVGTTGRKVYRSAAGATALKLLATIANNTDTTYTDNIADGSLGAAKETVNAAAATALAATVKFSEAASDRLLTDAPQEGVIASTLVGNVVIPACTYSLRAITGATTGALANLQAYLIVEYVADPAA